MSIVEQKKRERENSLLMETGNIRYYSIIIPVYNRPDEVDDLLFSLTRQTYRNFEVIVVEDGSTLPCKAIAEGYADRMDIRYFLIPNGGPSKARNYGAKQSKGDYLLILDSDCVLPEGYLEAVENELSREPADAFGGPDRAHPSFTPIQKAISYAMTSFFTTGGIRGGKKKLDKFYPRSFNMGVRRDVFMRLQGFDTSMRYGEDIDFSTRLFQAGCRTRLFPEAYVYHKRRTSFSQFFRQVEHSGEARIVLWKKYPGTLKPVHCLPALFVLFVFCILVAGIGWPLLYSLLMLYILLIFFDAAWQNGGDLYIGMLSVAAAFTQLFGYGIGFIRKYFNISR